MEGESVTLDKKSDGRAEVNMMSLLEEWVTPTDFNPVNLILNFQPPKL